jgi:pimeloyl-ACP methyl ester carboxylesterase
MAEQISWLLLHGTPLTPEAWDGVRAALEAVHPVEAPLLPKPDGPADAQGTVATAVEARLDPGRRYHVVGHSFGGQVALDLALQVPDRVASLTILCSRASPFPAFAAAAASIRSGHAPDLDGAIQRWFTPDEVAADGPVVEWARRCLSDADLAMWADELDAIAVYDRRAALASLATPTAIIAAELDHVGTPEEMEAMATAIPGATFSVIPDASHLSPFVDPAGLAERLVTAAG